MIDPCPLCLWALPWQSCPLHPDVLLPAETKEAGKHLCPLCAWQQRAAAYAQQKQATAQP